MYELRDESVFFIYTSEATPRPAPFYNALAARHALFVIPSVTFVDVFLRQQSPHRRESVLRRPPFDVPRRLESIALVRRNNVKV